MELKVFKDTLAAYGGRWETRQELPVETEILIPDYQPAVFKIVKCLMQPAVLQNRVAGGRWHCEGYLRCTVYYQSDEPGCRLYRTEQKFAFEKSVELPDASFAEGPAQVWGEQEYCNCRAVSEHRIDLRGAYILCATALMVRDCEVLTSLADCGIEQRTQELSGLTRVAAEEKTLTSEINLPLPGAGETILDIGGNFTLTSLTLQTGQASCQGILQVQACCQPSESEMLDIRTKEMTIQQTVDLPGAAESDQCIAWGEVLHCTLRTTEGAADASLSVTWKLHLELWRLAAHTVVADAYSTLCQTQTVQTVCKLLQKAADLTGHLTVTVEDDLPTPDAEVRGCFVTLEAPIQTPEVTDHKEKAGENHWKLQGKGTAHVLCADSRGELTCYDKSFIWQPDGSWQGSPGDAYPCLHADVTRLTSGKSGTRLRVEVELNIIGAMLQAQVRQALSEVELGEMFDNGVDEPALYLYYAQEGERIFDIAKRYHARAKDLAAANHLETGNTAPQDLTTESTCLLIPAAL